LLEASVGADLLVVGARGYGEFTGALLGSVSQQCVHHTTVPIAIIRNSDELDAASRTKIVVGVDGSKESARALDWALDEARFRAAPITVVHAWQPAMLGAIEYAAPVLDYRSLEAAAQLRVDHALAAANTDRLAAPVDTLVVGSSAAEAIIDAGRDAAMIVVGSRGRGGFASLLLGSVGSRVVHHAECPVVVIPPDGRRPASAEHPAV
jgi:nucleotide-binding universal stress UspA family protein